MTLHVVSDAAQKEDIDVKKVQVAIIVIIDAHTAKLLRSWQVGNGLVVTWLLIVFEQKKTSFLKNVCVVKLALIYYFLI